MRSRPFALPAALAMLGLTATLARPAAAEEAEACKGHELTRGLCASAGLTADGFANLQGGLRRGTAAIGQLSLGLQADLGEVVAPALEGWRFNVSAFGIYGRQPGQALTGSLATPSNIEALSTFRLNELWLQRDLGGAGSIRFGQLAVDSEFATADAAGNLVNATFGWPVALSSSLPSGGVAYPFAAPGLRLALGDPEGGTGVRMGVYAGDPGGRRGEETDPQRHNRYGTNFSFTGGTFVILEGVVGASAPEGQEGPRPWVAKLGAWHHARGDFTDQRFADDGLSLADPASSGNPRRYRDNQGAYAIGEVTLWRDGGQSLATFARGFIQPGNRNAVSWQADAGLAWANPLGREGETASLGVSYARIGQEARGLDADTARFGDPSYPRRDGETVVEANYDIAVLPGRLSLRPIAQWIIRPGANAADEATGRPLGDAFLAGLRVKATF